MITKILKNNTGSDLFILTRTVPNLGEYTVPKKLWDQLADDEDLLALVQSGDLVVNDGDSDLSTQVGYEHVRSISGVIFEHNDIFMYPAAGVNAPEYCRISDAAMASCLQVGDEIFGQTRIDSWAGGDVQFQIHMSVDNNVADRWIQLEMNYITTNGRDDGNRMDVVDGTITGDLLEIPSNTHEVFEYVFTIPASNFSNGETYLYAGIKRITATGKTAPVEPPNVYRFCKRYYKKVEL